MQATGKRTLNFRLPSASQTQKRLHLSSVLLHSRTPESRVM